MFKAKGYYNLPLSKYPHDFNEDIILLGIACETGGRFKGTKHAPNYLRDLSKKVFVGQNRFLMGNTNRKINGFYNNSTNKRVLVERIVKDYGNIKLRQLEEFFCNKLYSGVPIFIGGDHSVTYHTIKSLQYREPTSVFYFDAHEDSAEKSLQCKNNNVVTWISSLPNVKNIYQVGLRGYSRNPVSIGVFCDIYPATTPDWSLLFPTENRNCYISIDLDVLDPLICPCVSTPVIGGVLYQDLVKMLSKICGCYSVVGIDIVEFVPKKDRDGLYGLLVLDLILKILELLDMQIRSI